MTDRPIISEVAMDVLEEVAIESTLHSLFDAASLEYTTDDPVAVTNTTPDEDEEPRTYFVWLFHAATNPELTVADLAATGSHEKIVDVRRCACPGFRFHRTPPASALRDSIRHGLAQVGECKHVEKGRHADRADSARGSDQEGARHVRLTPLWSRSDTSPVSPWYHPDTISTPT